MCIIVARAGHTSVVLSDDSVLVMGGIDDDRSYNDVWKTVDGGASWILVTSSAGWTGKCMQPAGYLYSLEWLIVSFVC